MSQGLDGGLSGGDDVESGLLFLFPPSEGTPFCLLLAASFTTRGIPSSDLLLLLES